MAAAKGMMDEEHGDPQTPPQRTDQNTYFLGCMGKFKVVIACLPKDEIGSSSAAAVARDMLFTFPNIRVGLLVGIGAGIPDYESEEIRDVRLGDVVISSGKENGGVELYDSGKRLGDGSFKATYALDRPPRPLRAALSQLDAEHQTRQNLIPQYINRMLEKYPYMRKRGFTHPGQSADKLFRADYCHVSGRSCAKCDLAEQIERQPENRPDTDPLIHYGVIATGSSVIKHALTREDIKQKHRAICLEMEAAGLMNNFPCVVIRGISDYADSHKNDQWQPYSAATAAACAKELLEYVQPRALDGERTAKDIVSQVLHSLSRIGNEVSTMGTIMNTDQKAKILNWLTPIDYGLQQSDFNGRRHEGTGQWLLDSDEFRKWFNESEQTLFCPGMPGAGKTMITSIIVEDIQTKIRNNPRVGVAYLYCNFRRQQEQKPTDLIASLLKQLIQRRLSVPEDITNLYKRHNDERTYPSFDELSKALYSIVTEYSRTFIIIDALDEYQVSDRSRKRFLSEILKLQRQMKINLFVTSRPIPEIRKKFEGCISLEIRASDEDVQRYVDGHASLLPSCVLDSPALQGKIKAEIIKAVDGMFLLAQLYLDSLTDKMTPKAIKLALEKLPKGSDAYDYAYKEAMERIESQKPGFYKLAKQALSWISCAKRPLTTSELRHSLAVEIGQSELDKENLPKIEDILSVCAGLVTVDKNSDIIRLIHYTTQEYFERTQSLWFPDAQKDIAGTCITYLSFNVFGSGFCLSDKEFEDRLRLNPFYDYAARQWGNHIREASDSQRSISGFLKSEAKASACSQAMMVSTRYYGYSQNVPRRVTGVHLTTWFGLADMTSVLLENGSHSDCKDSNGLTPLSWAAERGHEAVFRLLIERADVEADSKDKCGQTPLSRAAKRGHEAVVRLLIERADVEADSKDNWNRTPLSWTAESGHEAVVRLLVERADVEADSKDEYDQTPLSRAAERGHEAVVRLLIERAEVEADSKDDLDRTPLSWAAGEGHEAVVRLLIERAEVEADSKDNWNRTPLSRAAERGHEAVVRLLIERAEVEADSKDNWNRTPLSRAAERGHEAVVRLLIERADVEADSKDNQNRTPLSRAVVAERWLWIKDSDPEAVVRLLLTNDLVDVNARDMNGRTPLSWAAGEGHLTRVELLLVKTGIDLDSKDDEGLTPLQWATKKKHWAVARLLQSHNRQSS